MALRDHDYVIPANHNEEEVGVPDIAVILQDHDYIQQMPLVEIGPHHEEEDGEAHEVDMREEEDEIPGEAQEQEVPVEGDEEPLVEEDIAVVADVIVGGVPPETYRTLPGIRRNSTIYVDNLKYKYYKREILVNTISLVCERQKNRRHPMCYGTASVNRDIMDNRLSLINPHNHRADDIDFHVPYLREAIGNKGLDPTNTTASVRTIYNNEIIQHAEAARNYTHLQAVRRVGAMRSLQRPAIPQDMHTLAETLNNPQYPAYSQTLQVPPTRFFQQEVVINGRSVGVVFANRVAIELYREDLNTVTMVGIDETFKTVPSHPTDLKCLLTFQIVFNSVAFPMVYVLLGSMNEETYCGVLTIIRDILPLDYDRIRFVTDYERALMNAVGHIFPTSRLVCCWFHYTQSIVRYCHRKLNNILNLIQTHEEAARIFRMVLALPHLPATRNNPLCPNVCVLDGYNAIVRYARQFPEIQIIIEHFLNNYIRGFWIEQIGPEKFSVFREDHRTNNYLESFHSTLLKQMGAHPNIWDFLQRLVIIENQFFVEFGQHQRHLQIRDMRSRAGRENTTRIIRENVQQLNRDNDILVFLRRTGHQNDGYVVGQIGPYP
ncbi:uncharacterized protein LOC132951000 [Metopolophium dirhodum]|uniref:uncharacterized protein LOC132951000 n=1 Tax=Metopolophium dirhodum TaxID=44670 RepID=UPI0029900D21|nr:uncharacterized protein LOC132951000 [Metopolophium dirhodum]